MGLSLCLGTGNPEPWGEDGLCPLCLWTMCLLGGALQGKLMQKRRRHACLLQRPGGGWVAETTGCHPHSQNPLTPQMPPNELTQSLSAPVSEKRLTSALQPDPLSPPPRCKLAAADSCPRPLGTRSKEDDIWWTKRSDLAQKKGLCAFSTQEFVADRTGTAKLRSDISPKQF